MEEKKLNIFISILYFIGGLALFFIITCTPVDAATLKNSTSQYLINYKMSSYNELFDYWNYTGNSSVAGSGWTLKNGITLPSTITIDSDNDRFNWPIKLFQQRGTNYLDYLYLNAYNIRPYISLSSTDNPNLSNWCNPAINSNGCTFDIGFSIIWKVAIPNDTDNFDLSLQQSISYILNNYNKVKFGYYYYSDNQYNKTPIYVPLNTKVIQTYQLEEEGTTYYTLNVYYTQKIYNFAGFSTGMTRPAGDNDFYFNYGGFYFDTTEYDSYMTYLQFNQDSDLYWNINLQFNSFYYAYSNSSNGGTNDNITGDDSSKDEILRQQEETNKKLEEIYAKINDTSPPDTSGLGGSAGWLPAGPVDSIINLPLTFFQGLNNAMSTSCSPVNVPLPFVNQSVQLPCVNTLFNQINGFSTWWNAMGLIAAAFILYKYLIHLYQWVDNTLTFRENNWQDWGGI